MKCYCVVLLTLWPCPLNTKTVPLLVYPKKVIPCTKFEHSLWDYSFLSYAVGHTYSARKSNSFIISYINKHLVQSVISMLECKKLLKYLHFTAQYLISPAGPARRKVSSKQFQINCFWPGPSARTPQGELTINALSDPESDEKGLLPPHSPPLSPWDPRLLRSPSELVPPLFRPKLRPWW